MLCRWCGMESKTTDVCEWCGRPMGPPDKAAKEGAEAEKQAAGDHDTQKGAQMSRLETEESGRDGEAKPQQPAANEEGEAAAPGDVLRPLGSEADERKQRPQAHPQQPGVPDHGLSDDSTRTSVDISQYVGDDDSIFRPIERPEKESGGGRDLLRTERRKEQGGGGTEEISENQRLGRCVLAGLIISLVVALVQYFATDQTVQVLYVRLSRGEDLLAALKYGIASGLILGLGLGAILVRLKKGPFLGLIIGLVVAIGFQNYPWALIQGGLAGIFAGRFATVGLRRVVNV